LKVVLGIPWYFPHSIGGTEVYVATLCHELQKLDVECLVATPSVDGKAITSNHGGVRVVHYPGPLRISPSESILATAPADALSELLASEQPDVYHQHDWSLNCGLTHLQAARRLRIPTIITLHLPKLVCRMSTMMYHGHLQCDGKIVEQRCAECFLTTRGLPSALAGLISKIPTDAAAGLAHLAGVGRLFSGRNTARQFAEGLRSVADTVDRIITVSQWLKQALHVNGVPESKLWSIRSGVDPEVALLAAAGKEHRRCSGLLRIGFLGRWNSAKGLHVLVAALQRLPPTMYTLRVLAAGVDAESVAYRQKIEKMVVGKPQFQLFSNKPRSAVSEFFQDIDVLAVPSQWLENAPLVVLEANAWKVPVVGSSLGGIREMVRHQVDGLLVPHDDIEAWASAFSRLANDPNLLSRLRENILPVRTMRDTASEMLALYRTIARAKSMPAT
jgi:glycosyltransferase involved in cell wall biosynthesis